MRDPRTPLLLDPLPLGGSVEINKTSFLLFASSIAASACVIVDERSSGGGGGSGGSGNASSSGSGQTSSTGTTSSSTGTGQGCDDSMGTAGDCSKHMTSCTEGLLAPCYTAQTYFKPKVAAAAVSCVLALKSSAACDELAKCNTTALSAACPDASADSLCTKLVANCNKPPMFPLDQAGCRKLVDGLKSDGRDKAALQCGGSFEGACGSGLAACINYELF